LDSQFGHNEELKSYLLLFLLTSSSAVRVVDVTASLSKNFLDKIS